jgi:hypothetical protein
MVAVHLGDRWSGDRHGRHQQRIETTRLRCDSADQIATGGPKSDVLDSGHVAGTLDTRPNAGVVLTAASIQQRLRSRPSWSNDMSCCPQRQNRAALTPNRGVRKLPLWHERRKPADAG